MVVAVSLLIISLTVGLAKLCISSIAGVSTLETLKTIKKGRSSFLKSQCERTRENLLQERTF